MRVPFAVLLLSLTPLAFAQRVPQGLPQLTQHAANGAAESAAPGNNGAPNDDGKRAGDEQLGCEQLQSEFNTIQSSPEVQAALASQVSQGQQFGNATDQLQHMIDAAQAQRHGVAANAARGFAQSLNPFGARRRAEKQIEEQKAQGEEVRKALGPQPSVDASSLQPAMPLLARGNRVMELARNRKCDWVNAPAQPAPGADQKH